MRPLSGPWSDGRCQGRTAAGALSGRRGRLYHEPGASERNFTLANRNNATSPRPPALADADDTYPGGWGLRREGNGVTLPRMIPGECPTGDLDALHEVQAEATFPTGDTRYAMPPMCDAYPDADTYRDLEFYLLERRTPAG